MGFQPLKVGELARRTGLTVRALHHYDAVGLVSPSVRSDGGHRLYSAADLARLQRVVSLKHLGFTLDEIRDCLDRPGFDPLAVLDLHAKCLRARAEEERRLADHLEALAARLRAGGAATADDFLRTIEVTTMVESYYTPEQLDELKRRREEYAAQGIDIAKTGADDWAALMADLTAAMTAGLDPASADVQALEARRRALIAGFTGGNPGIEQSLNRLWKEKGSEMAAQHGYSPDLMAYLGRVIDAGKGN